MDDAPSTNSSHIYDYEDIYWTKNISKKLHDPLLMAKVKVGKLKKDGPSSSKAQVHKTPKKKGQKFAPPISRPSLPKSMKYVIKQIPTHFLKFGPTYNIDFINDLNKYMGVNTFKLFKNSIFGPYLGIHTCNYQGQISKSLLLLEIEQDNIHELHVRHTSGNILFQYFLQSNWDNTQDAFQMGILYFINSFVLSQLPDASIHVNDFLMVEDGRYEHFPWGQLKQLYHLGGMPYALNVWVYECASVVNDEIVVKEGDYILRILNWRVVGVKPKFEMFMSSIFSEFEDFSSKPPDQLLRRSRHVSSTSSTPPPKRRKKDDLAQPKSSAMEHSEQSPVIQKEPFSIPDSAGNIPDFHGPSSDPKEKKDIPDIEEVKQYMKEYVSDSHNYY
ncbi:hypothetical protein R3W88_019293 [Solanum pinnatisectum]|uniref:Uncharacterized protein n=1 Tax=Solanum pinnatisectum TaxID=50273 RepID=A0AAV9KJA9_9SOLN|nr:hypothetical protein R3W88_019293 [Solanum pinnatisectum]